ncbi:CobW family GTP-binding protein [Candidatus Clostridium radicumherbarum]|uniref:CobW family GTP-binding protein n=1 Tax=Candidatus Clostridium radicumherbarum TaxID=3381662 RepID=A0ABW8TUH1_9CLOT
MKVKIDIISGFLGAGKTTLIKKLITEELYKEKIAIIENEFGEVGIDGSTLKSTKVKVKEINAGCICCSITGDFKKALLEVLENYRLDRIIIEPSGVAKLSEIIKVCNSEDLRKFSEINMIITVVDILKFHMYLANFGEFYKNQIINAKTIMLSRSQRVGLEKLVTVKEALDALNKEAFVVTTPWDNLTAKRIIEISESYERERIHKEVNLLKKPGSKVSYKITPGESLSFESIGFETVKRFSLANIKSIFDKISNEKLYGSILRAKGIVQLEKGEWAQFDYVPEEFNQKNTEADFSGRVCIIGINLNKAALKKLFI